MSSEIFINSNQREIRVALMESNLLAELFIEHKSHKGIVGNIYKGKVTKILPGMQVAFVDIGLDKAGFLYVGDIDVIDKLSKVSSLKAVFGNIDNAQIRSCTNENELLNIEGFKILITHIAGKQPNYNNRLRKIINNESPDILIYGHSHILRVENDKKNDIICINPGAAGKHGFHKKRTMIRFNLNEKKIENMEIVELGNRSSLS